MEAGKVNLGDLRTIRPIDNDWGYARGLPIDRYYIEKFLAQNAADIKGRVLEFADNSYTTRFGTGKVTTSDIMNYSPSAHATFIGDLAKADHVPSGIFDCIILTQVLLFVYDIKAAIKALHRILKPGGIVLVTLPGIAKICRDADDYWHFTGFSARRLFEEQFGKEKIQVQAKGNVLTAAAFLYGMAAEELSAAELDHEDPDYQVCITVRAVK